VEDARIESTYQNYRTALATGNTVLANALRGALLRDRDAAIRYAREDSARASDPVAQEIARKVLESLGRSP
jgi:hypothetical protein